MKKGKHGGYRQGAGRPQMYGEPTQELKVACPVSKIEQGRKMLRTWLKQFEVKKVDAK